MMNIRFYTHSNNTVDYYMEGENNMVRELYKGFYKHFKEFNSDGEEMVYYVHDVCEDTETGELKVYYQALYGDMNRYVREIKMFLSLTDKVKYPLSTQKYRFEKMSESEVKEWVKRNKTFVEVNYEIADMISGSEELITLFNIL